MTLASRSWLGKRAVSECEAGDGLPGQRLALQVEKTAGLGRRQLVDEIKQTRRHQRRILQGLGRQFIEEG